MNAVEIEQAITDLAEQPFDPTEFPYAFLEAFGNKATTIKRLRAGASNKSDLGGVLQTSNIHILTCDAGRVAQTLVALKASPATSKAKAKFILATDGADFEAEDLNSGQTVACAFKDFPDHFGFFLPLAGISTVRQISENAFDIRATSRLNRLYVELLKDNPEWGTEARRHDMNHFMARLIFCFFAEDTDIFGKIGLFTETVERMSDRDSSNTHEVIAELFRAMNTPQAERATTGLSRWAISFSESTWPGRRSPLRIASRNHAKATPEAPRERGATRAITGTESVILHASIQVHQMRSRAEQWRGGHGRRYRRRDSRGSFRAA